MTRKLFVAACFLAITFFAACSKSGSSGYITTDHTVGMLNTRQWTGAAWGFSPGDTTISSVLYHDWPRYFGRNITDTSFSVIKIDGFFINMLGIYMPFKSADSVAQTVIFDSTSTSLAAHLIFFYAADSMSFTLHRVDGFNATAAQYNQLSMTLHTK